jgi:S-adenosylmethionine-dependent methyltransferase
VVTSVGGQRDELRLVSGLLASLRSSAPPGRVARVLDCGGGTGRVAVPLAQLGAQVTVVDISGDALATLSRRAIEAGVADRVQAVAGDIEVLSDWVGDQVFDLVLVHGVLDAVDATATLSGVRGVLRPGGAASILVANPAAAVLARVLAGELEAAIIELRSRPDFGVEVITRLCVEVGLDIERLSGVGVFSELMAFGAPVGVTAAGNSIADRVDELEDLSADLSPFREIAARLHILARRGR